MNRKDVIPPFEIMRRPAGGVPVEDAPEGAARAEGRGAGTGRWWGAWSTPIVLRVPRGVAVLAGGGLLMLLAGAYLVGHARAARDLQGRINAAVEDEMVLIGGRGMAPPEVRGSTAILGRGPGVGAAVADGGAADGAEAPRDPRTPGLNYMVLATLRASDALPLVGFLREHGVETILVSRKVRGSELVQVVAVNRGFDGPALSSQVRQDYESRLRALGRAWKRHNNNRGDALGSMYFEKYDGQHGS